MDYREYIFSQKAKPNYWKLAWRWTKIVLYLFLIILMLWGCAELFIPKFNSYKVHDISGQNVYKPGVFFEIVIGALLGKNHFFHQTSNGSIHEYSYLAIGSWKQAFTKTQSPFFGCFVYPIALLLTSLIQAFGGIGNGVGILGAIFLASLIVRSATLIFSFKAQMNQEKMQTMQLKQATIQAKYKGSKDPAAKQKQQMEIMQMYKKEGMSPLSNIGMTFLSFPFLLAMYTVIKSVRQLKMAQIGQISLINQPWSEITSGHLIYLVLLVVYLPLQLLSMFLPTILAIRSTKIITAEQKKARRKQFIIQGVMGVVFLFVAVSIAAGVAVYWIFSAFIQIMQTLFFHWLRYSRRRVRHQKRLTTKKPFVINPTPVPKWHQKLHPRWIFAKISPKNSKFKIFAKKAAAVNPGRNSELTQLASTPESPQPIKVISKPGSRAQRKTQAKKLNQHHQLKPNFKNPKQIIKIGQKPNQKANIKNKKNEI